MKKILSILTLALALWIGNIVHAATTIELTASPAKGVFSGPVYVKLVASDPEAKIWYTCNRNGTPADALPYEKPILLSKSCALIAFAYTDYEHESKIIRNDYTIKYSEDVKLEYLWWPQWDALALVNTGKNTVDIGNWELFSTSGNITIPSGVTLSPGARYALKWVPGTSYILKSPDTYEKYTLSIPKKIETLLLSKQSAEKPAPTKKTPIASSTKTETIILSGSGENTLSETASGYILSETTTPPPSTNISPPPKFVQDSTPANIHLKASASETTRLPYAIPIIGIIIALLIGTKVTLVILKR